MAEEQQTFHLDLTVRSDKATLRMGLKDWEILGLLTPDQIREIESVYQIGIRPEPVKANQAPQDQDPLPDPEIFPPIPLKTSDPMPPGFLESLGAELGVRWLLWIGLFLVVVSSGLLAASQWNRLAALGQYGVLFAYTLGFLGAAGWAKRQDSLQLTAETLELIALLLVPINGWAMSSLGIPVLISLGAMGILGFSAHRLTQAWIPIGVMVNFALLATVPLVWDWGPLEITYAGIGMTVIYGILRPLYSNQLRHMALLTLAESLLLLRGLLAGDLVISQLAVVVAWVTWEWSERRLKMARSDGSLDQSWEEDSETSAGNATGESFSDPVTEPSTQKPWEWEWMLGILALSWILAGWDDIVISRLSISLLGIRVLSAWLAQTRRPVDLVLLFGVGLEAMWATGRILPELAQVALRTLIATPLGAEDWQLAGITLLPYVALWLWLTEQLRRDPQYSDRILTQTSEWLTLWLGGLLLVISLGDPALLAVHLLLGAGILAVWLHFKPEPPQWQRVLTWGYLIGAGAAGIVDWGLSWGLLDLIFSPKLWLWSWAGFVAGLMVVRAAVREQTGPWIRALQMALDLWGGILTGLLLLATTFLHSFIFLDSSIQNASWPQRVMGEFCISLVLLTAAIGIRLWTEGDSGSNLRRDGLIYALGWGSEGILVYGLGAVGSTPLEVASIAGVANLGLGILAWQVGDVALRRDPELSQKLTSLRVGPLIWGGIGWVMLAFNRDLTGLGSLGLSILCLGLGQRGSRWLRILGAAGFSVAAYEGLIEVLSRQSGENVGDGLSLLALLGLVLGLAYRGCPLGIRARLGLDLSVMKTLAHLNWGFASFLLVLGLFSPISLLGSHLWIGGGIGLIAYALWQSWQQESPEDSWSYAASVEVIGLMVMMIETWIPALDWLAWSGTLAAGLGLLYALLPWQRWGWRAEPWLNISLVLPGLAIGLTAGDVNRASLLIGAAYYGWLAIQRSQARLSYVSLVLSNWVLYDWFWSERWYSFSLWTLPVSFSLVAVAQLDPALAHSRSTRHGLRSASVGLLCLTVWIETTGQLWGGFGPVGIGILLAILGLGLRVRAFLWMGSLSFGLGLLRQIALLIARYPVLLWGVGILVGLGLIGFAATVERRRTLSWWSTWSQDLQNWD